MKYLTKEQQKLLEDFCDASEENSEAMGAFINEMYEAMQRGHGKATRRAKRKVGIHGVLAAAGTFAVLSNWDKIKKFIEEKTGKKDYRDIDLTDEDEI